MRGTNSVAIDSPMSWSMLSQEPLSCQESGVPTVGTGKCCRALLPLPVDAGCSRSRSKTPAVPDGSNMRRNTSLLMTCYHLQLGFRILVCPSAPEGTDDLLITKEWVLLVLAEATELIRVDPNKVLSLQILNVLVFRDQALPPKVLYLSTAESGLPGILGEEPQLPHHLQILLRHDAGDELPIPRLDGGAGTEATSLRNHRRQKTVKELSVMPSSAWDPFAGKRLAFPVD